MALQEQDPPAWHCTPSK